MNIATCPYCGEDVRFSVPPKMGEPAFCPTCKMAAVVVWLAPVVLEDAIHMQAEAERSGGFGRSGHRDRRGPRRERVEDREDSSFGRKRRGADDRRRRPGKRAGWYDDD